MSFRLRSDYLCFIPSNAHTRVGLKFGVTSIFGAVIEIFVNTQRRRKEECELLKWITNIELTTS